MSHIEQTDRGLTIDKKLAWAVISVIAAGGFWVGILLADLRNQSNQTSQSIDQVMTGLAQERQTRVVLAGRVEALEQGSSRDNERFNNIMAALNRIERRFDRFERESR